MKAKHLFCYLSGTVLLMSAMSCTCNRNGNEDRLVGSDKDCHGCIASAGYRWSSLLQKCIRPFEEGMVIPSVDESSSFGAFAVFNADSSRLELFLPERESGIVLQKDVIGVSETVWVSGKKDDPTVREKGDVCEVILDGEVRYRR